MGTSTVVDTVIENKDGSNLTSTETTTINGTVTLTQEENKADGTKIETDKKTKPNGDWDCYCIVVS